MAKNTAPQDEANSNTQAFGTTTQIDPKEPVAQSSNSPSHTDSVAKPDMASQAIRKAIYYSDDPEDYDVAPLIANLSYQRTGKLPQIPAKPGFTQYWGSVKERDGTPLVKNMAKYEGKGWNPRPPRTVPNEFRHLIASFAGYDQGVVMVEGCILYEMPISMKKKLDAAKEQLANAAVSAAKVDLQNTADQSGVELFVTHNQERERITKFG